MISFLIRTKPYYFRRTKFPWQQITTFRSCCHEQIKLCTRDKPKLYLSSKEIRKLFIKYFVEDKKHTYVHSAPVFLNNDPSLLFVNAGMNQFKAKLLNKVLPSHSFYDLKRAANIQKCVRISGKHNDLDDVGHDFHHHTFFEMMGSWSFGDYYKKEACSMAWEILTKIYGLPKERLYVTYFGGDESLQLPADVECKNIWLDIGVPESHVLPFGVKENFWDMGETGPCGPCTEIHYDYLGANNDTLSPSIRVNAGRSDLIELWNLVFIQYKREKNGQLEYLPFCSVDTGMGLERLTAVLQGTTSNYNTDIFVPIFQAIEKNFNVKPYEGNLGNNDVHGIDTAYRIIADHARMFTVAIADGLFPDSYDQGHVLRKIIRRASYMANKVMKARPGLLSSVVPYVAETLEFFPEIEGHIDQVTAIVNEEERMFHQLINRGRKIRNMMMAKATSCLLEGKNVWELHNVHGLEENVIQDLATEVNFQVDWDGYHQISKEEASKRRKTLLSGSSIQSMPANVVELLNEMDVPNTVDNYKYNYCLNGSQGVHDLKGFIVAIIADGKMVNSVEAGKCCFLITDKTNFYSSAGGQVSDIGVISAENSVFCVEDVHSVSGYILHEGKVMNGMMLLKEEVKMIIEKDHRHRCSCNHTATHLLNAALQKILPYTAQRSSYVGPDYLRLGFSNRDSLNITQISQLEDFVNNAISEKHPVVCKQVFLDDVIGMPNIVFLQGEEYPEEITLVSIGSQDNHIGGISVEPCCGTHVHNTADLGSFVILNSKSHGGTLKTLNAVTGKVAEKVLLNSHQWQQYLNKLKTEVLQLEKNDVDMTEALSLLKEVKKMLHKCNFATDVPLRTVRNCETELKDLKLKLVDITSVQQDDLTMKHSGVSCRKSVPDAIKQYVQANGITATNDSHKYSYCLEDNKQCILPVQSKIIAIFQNDVPVQSVQRGQPCIIVTNETNFYSEDCNQAGDIGFISNEDFNVEVTDVHSAEGCVFHSGWVKDGCLELNSDALMTINQEHRRNCSLNHTASHLLNSALKKHLPYVFIQSVFADASYLRLQFKSKGPLFLDVLQDIENSINTCIKEHLNVSQIAVPLKQVKDFPNISVPTYEVYYSEPASVVSIGSEEQNSVLTSIEPCCGTHARNTSELDHFLIVTSKSGKNMEKVIRAVTGKTAESVIENGKVYDKEMSELEKVVLETLESKKDFLAMWDLLRDVKAAKNYHEVELPLLLFRKHQHKLTELTLKLTNETEDFVQQGFVQIKSEVARVVEQQQHCEFIVHKINTRGDGKKIVNIALAAVKDKPAMFLAYDGYRTVICSCIVPKDFRSSSLTALLWVQPVATLLRGRARVQNNDPELYYSFESNDIHKIDEAVDVAKSYIKSCL